MRLEDEINPLELDWEYIWQKSLKKGFKKEKDWDKIASEYGKWLKNDDYPDVLLNEMRISSKDTVLDMGCGEGTITRKIAKKAKSVTGIDKSELMLEELNKKAKDENIKNIKTFQKDINDLSYVSTNDKVPSMETNLHIFVYQKRPDVNSVVHVHSPYATAFAFSDKKLRQLEGFGEITGEYITEVDYYPPGSKKLAKHASDTLKNEDCVLLKDHGVITVGKNIDEATLLCEYVEGIAKTQYITHVLNL